MSKIHIASRIDSGYKVSVDELDVILLKVNNKLNREDFRGKRLLGDDKTGLILHNGQFYSYALVDLNVWW